MPKYKVPCTWQMTGHYIVEADDIEQAKEKTYDLPLSEAQDIDYLQGSFEPDIDECIEIVSVIASAPLTSTEANSVRREAEKAGISPSDWI